MNAEQFDTTIVAAERAESARITVPIPGGEPAADSEAEATLVETPSA